MIEVLKLDHLGRGIGKINNKVIFIPNTLPGEIVEINITKDKKNYCEGRVVNYIKKSSSRIQAKCPYFEKCGGCDLMHLTYTDQLKYKQQKIEDIICRYTNLNIKISPIIPSDNIYNYRNKMSFHVNSKSIGLYEKQSNKIINIEKCLLADQKINTILNKLNKMQLNAKNIIIRATNDETMIYYDGNINNIESLNINTIVNEDKIIKGSGHITETLNKMKFIISPQSFFQINTRQTIKLYDKIKEMANISKTDKLLDLYCGTGTIGLYISNSCNNVIGIDICKSAIDDANKNKILNNIDNATYIASDAKDAVKNLNFKPDVVVIDPPRSGLFKGMANDIFNFKSPKIIYVSCNPITLARDLQTLSNMYNIQEIQPIDLFPHTYHVECIVLLTIKKFI